MQNKITVVGAGNVGASCALYLAQQELGDVVLIDIMDGVAKGKALDILQTGAVQNFDSNLIGTGDYADTAGSDIVVVTAGLARKPGMDRLDLLKKNAEIVSNIVDNVKQTSPNAIIIMVTNPIDVMVYLAFRRSGWPSERVIGQAGILDSARYATFIAMELGVSVKEVNAMILGGHGDTMVPLPRFSTVSGIPITELMPPNRIAAIGDRARAGGGEIVKLLGTGSAYYAPAAATVKMVESILHDSNHLLPCSVYLTGQYGINGIYIGVPAKLGRKGVTEIVEVKLEPAEQQALLNSAEVYKKSVEEVSEFFS
jgi:malate dehydrogenase